MKVLIVEDTEDSRVMLERVLVSSNFDVESAINGVEAFVLAKVNHPDIIVSDIMMPEMDGFELCRKVKADPELTNIPFVFYTATYTERKDKDLAQALGAARFILKPAKPQDFLTVIKEVLEETIAGVVKTAPKVPTKDHVLNNMYRDSLSIKLDKKNTELEEGRQSLVKSEEKFRTIVEAMGDGVSIIDENLNMQYANSFLVERFGSFEGKKCYKFFNGEDGPCPLCGSKALAKGDLDRVEWEWVCAADSRIYNVTSVLLNKIGDSGALLEIRRDITDQRRSEAKVVEHTAHRNMLLDSLPHPTMLIRKNKTIISSNNAASKFGALPGKICWQTFTNSQFISDEERAYYKKYDTALQGTCCVFCKADECLETQKSLSELNVELHGRVWNMHWVPLNSDTYLHYAIDMTEERARSSERELLMLAIKQAAEVVIITDALGIIQYANPVFEQITGYSCDEVIGKNPKILASGKQNKDFYRAMWETLRHGDTWIGQFVNKKKDGTLYTEDASISPVVNISGEIINYVAVKRDITKEMRLQEGSRRMQKMESIGRLAGGIAHDYNNMLGVILGYLEISVDGMDSSHPLYDNLMEIRKAADRSVGVTRQLLAFARKQPFTTEVLNLNENVAGMFNMLHRLIGENIEITWQPGDDLWSVKVDSSQIDHILANLCINARDAIDGTGKITIETKNVEIKKIDYVDYVDFIPGEYVLLAVSDDGSGMDTETMNNMFEPFFTTKEVGKGTGMGLATVYGIIKQNNGFVDVYSELGFGTTIKIYIPRYIGAKKKKDQHNNLTDLNRGGRENILLVEDEPALLNIVQMMLQRSGYTVLAASSPDEAFSIAKKNTLPIDMLVTDVMLPGMNGKSLAAKLISDFPGLKCLFMSGYTSGAIAHQGILDEGMFFIQKPFALTDLIGMVRKVLDSK